MGKELEEGVCADGEVELVSWISLLHTRCTPSHLLMTASQQGRLVSRRHLKSVFARFRIKGAVTVLAGGRHSLASVEGTLRTLSTDLLTLQVKQGSLNTNDSAPHEE
jgi:hypothetical protein